MSQQIQEHQQIQKKLEIINAISNMSNSNNQLATEMIRGHDSIARESISQLSQISSNNNFSLPQIPNYSNAAATEAAQLPYVLRELGHIITPLNHNRRSEDGVIVPMYEYECEQNCIIERSNKQSVSSSSSNSSVNVGFMGGSIIGGSASNTETNLELYSESNHFSDDSTRICHKITFVKM